MFNDRSVSRIDEERQYDQCAALAVTHQDEVASRQWEWARDLVQDTAGAKPGVLDVGCGDGAFLKRAVAEGWRGQGIEIDPAAAARCSAQGIPVVVGSVFDVDVPRGPWQLITLWDVLDHLENPGEALSILVRELAPGGVIAIRGRNARVHVPVKAFHKRHASAMGRLRVPDLAVVHRWGLSRDGYLALLRQAGLEQLEAHPGLPTEGDRYGAFRRAGLNKILKRSAAAATMALFAASNRRIYPFTSVLMTGRRPAQADAVGRSSEEPRCQSVGS